MSEASSSKAASIPPEEETSGGAAENVATSSDSAPASVFQFSDASSRNVADILAKDSEDESLRRYKESLLGSAAHGDLGDVSDPRRLVVTEFAVVFDASESQPDIVHRLDTL